MIISVRGRSLKSCFGDTVCADTATGARDSRIMQTRAVRLALSLFPKAPDFPAFTLVYKHVWRFKLADVSEEKIRLPALLLLSAPRSPLRKSCGRS